MPPPQPQPQLTHVAPPRLLILAQPNPNPNNRQEHQAPNGETSHPAYVVEVQKVNLRSGRVIPDNHHPSPPIEVEEEKEEGNTQIQYPTFPERLIHPSQHTPEETKLLGELEILCVKIPLLQAIKDVLIHNRFIK